MAEITKDIITTVNKPGRFGTLGTADAQGRPNVAYFGSPRLEEDGTFVIGLAKNRTLKNLEVNPHAVFFCLEESAPVSFTSKGYRLYLKVRELQTSGAQLDAIRDAIAKAAGPGAAKMIAAAVVFDVTEIRPLIAMG
jgi:hypothetical protein